LPRSEHISPCAQGGEGVLPCISYIGERCPKECRLRVVSNFEDGDCGAEEVHTHVCEISRRHDARGACACVYFARPTIAIAKIRDYLESTRSMVFEPFWSENGYRI